MVLLLGLVTANIWLLHGALEKERADRTERQFWLVCQAGQPASVRADAFLTLVRRGNTEWRSARLNGLDLAGSALEVTRLSEADFRGSNLRAAKLGLSVLTRALLGKCDLSGADLQTADLSGADLYRANLTGANFNQAKLRATNFQEADLKQATLLLADLSEADFLMASCVGTDLSGANLTGARLEATVLRGANLSLTRLSGADLKDADFTNSNWWRSRGLSSIDLARLMRDFQPGTNAPAELRADFEDWKVKGD